MFRDGRIVGDIAFSKGALAYLLASRIYAGEHPAIIDRELWEAVQVIAAARPQAP